MIIDPGRAYLSALGLRIRLLCTARRLSRDQLGQTADVARALVGSIERGEHPAGLLSYARLAAALGLPLRDLIDPDSADRNLLRLVGNSSD